MSEPEQPQTPPTPEPQRSFRIGRSDAGPLATLPLPGNAELVVYLVVLLVFALIWAASDRLDAGGFVTAVTVLTAAYLLSRGIAKASRVYEQ